MFQIYKLGKKLAETFLIKILNVSLQYFKNPSICKNPAVRKRRDFIIKSISYKGVKYLNLLKFWLRKAKENQFCFFKIGAGKIFLNHAILNKVS